MRERLEEGGERWEVRGERWEEGGDLECLGSEDSEGRF